MGPGAVKIQFILALDLLELVFGKAEGREVVDELGREHLGLAVKGVTGKPDQFLFAEADRTRVIELGAKLALVDYFGKGHMLAAVDDRKRYPLVRVKFPDHLQHQKLVEIGVEQAAHDRVEPPAVIVGPRCDIRDCHGRILSRPSRCNQCESCSTCMADQREIPPRIRLTTAPTSLQAGFSGANCRRRKETSSTICSSDRLSLKAGI